MRLYQHTESERTGRGQGAHKRLRTVFSVEAQNGERVEVGTVHMRHEEERIVIESTVPAKMRIETQGPKTAQKCEHQNCDDEGNCHACDVNVFR